MGGHAKCDEKTVRLSFALIVYLYIYFMSNYFSGLKVRTAVLPGVTDSRYVRQMNIPALGFSPITNTPILLHDNDEYLQADTYLRGIEIYENILPGIANA